MPTPIYRFEDLNTAFHLRFLWTGWPTVGTIFPQQPDESFFCELDKAWKLDSLNRISTKWDADKIQIAFSTIPTVSPTFFVSRVKGRLQHALRLAGTAYAMGQNAIWQRGFFVGTFSEYDVRALRQ